MRLLPDGEDSVFSLTKQILKKGEFKNGYLWKGRTYIYDKNGVLTTIKIYKDGKFYGDEYSFQSQEELKMEKINSGGKFTWKDYGEMKDDKIWNGKRYFFNKDDILVKISIYKMGKYVGDVPLYEDK